jgi:hypothetical protein
MLLVCLHAAGRKHCFRQHVGRVASVYNQSAVCGGECQCYSELQEGSETCCWQWGTKTLRWANAVGISYSYSYRQLDPCQGFVGSSAPAGPAATQSLARVLMLHSSSVCDNLVTDQHGLGSKSRRSCFWASNRSVLHFFAMLGRLAPCLHAANRLASLPVSHTWQQQACSSSRNFSALPVIDVQALVSSNPAAVSVS